jgi:hypothetical protein
MEAQGYQVNDNVLFQDNKSAILLEKNGKASSSKRTKHISIRYFFITDRVKKGDVSLAWCPTGDMIGDYMTKPLQGALFRKFRPRPNHGSGPCTESMARKDQAEKRRVGYLLHGQGQGRAYERQENT